MGKGLNDFANSTVGSGLIGTAMGLMLEGHQDRRQLRQQERLGHQQMKFNKEMADYNQALQFDMWNKTNYGAQMEHLKKAGLNPALLYGTSGGGGVTTGSATGGPVSGGMAPGGGGEIMGIMGMKMQQALTNAQVENIKADTELKNVERENKAGVEREKGYTEIASLTQGINNQKAVEILTKAETNLKNIQGVVQGESIYDQIDYIRWNAQQAINLVKLSDQEIYMNERTREDKVKIVREEAIGSALRNILTIAQTDKTKSDIQVNNQGIIESNARIQKMAADIDNAITGLMQGNVSLSQETQKLAIERFKAGLEQLRTEFQTSYPTILQQAGKAVKEGADKIDKLNNEINNLINSLFKK